jgi:hypothetical protein
MKWTILARTGTDKDNSAQERDNGTLPTPNQQDQNKFAWWVGGTEK